ncbi:SDR family NAD(P)-dependent oxidoreductase [Microbacterium rhizophilus]|uniref:SDR family NAD(P)-dependent oxidoreductase n=1 Tax=Microbacterium rhizophilus TaxID=3138934 RepID=UPI0031E9E2F8
MTQISGAIAVVTGGAAGIGRGIAETLRDEGATVVIADIEQEALDRAARELGVEGVRVDVSDAASVAALAGHVVRVHGGVDIVVNNAGVGPQGRIADLTLDDWRWILDVNLLGVIHGVHAFLPLLRANPAGGHIVNTASMSAFAPMPGLGAYAASKAGVAALTEVLAAELAEDAPDIGVTLLTPGSVHTDIARSLRNRPAGTAQALTDVDFAANPGKTAGAVWLTPGQVGRVVARAIRNDDFYAITHPGLLHRVETRHDGIRRAFEAYPPVAEAPQPLD